MRHDGSGQRFQRLPIPDGLAVHVKSLRSAPRDPVYMIVGNGLVGGGTVGLDAMFGGPITGACMNPARSLGPAVASADYASLWIYLLAPIVGAVVAAAGYEFLRAGAS